MRGGVRRLCAAAVLGLAFFAPATKSFAAQKVAVFPFDIRDISQEMEFVPQYQENDLKRLKLVADELRKLLAADARYEVIDLTPYAAEVEAASPFMKCNGCEAEIAKKAGAELAITGNAEKLSDALISLQVFGRDAETGQLVKSMSAEIRGNTDELWLHGINYLWRNRFHTEPQKTEPKSE